jgi:serine protease Do
MKAKYFTLLVAIILTTGITLAQQPTPPAPPANSPQEPFGNTFSLLTDGGGFLGVYAEDISRENMGQYNLNQVRGVGVTRIVKDSPAEKAGLRKDDVILRVDGENITSVRKLNRLVSEIAPDQSVKVVISRGGSERELTATISKRNNSNLVEGWPSENPKMWKWEGPLPGRDGPFSGDSDLHFVLGNSRRIGISTMELTRQLADYFGVANGKGVLVTSVTEDGPAAKAGVKAGDVITAIDGESVDSPGDISRAINRKKEGEVALTIIRNKTQQTIRVTPKEGSFTMGTLGSPQIGRRIVIPRVELPEIPAINISTPRIELPTIPSINIELPRIRVNPRVWIVRTTSGPI